MHQISQKSRFLKKFLGMVYTLAVYRYYSIYDMIIMSAYFDPVYKILVSRTLGIKTTFTRCPIKPVKNFDINDVTS